MDSEVKIIISFLFKRSGKEELTFSELYLPLSIDLKWFSPKESKAFVNSAILKKFLIKKGELIIPNFDYKKIIVPFGFNPSKQQYNEDMEAKKENPDVIKQIIKQIIEKTNQNDHSILEEIKEIKKERSISLEVAALLVCVGYDIDVSIFFDRIEEKIFVEDAK